MKNFIIKVTIKYESDKYRKPAYWTRLDKNSIYWFPYYYATGRSVCGNVDRIECGYDKAFTTFGLEEALSNASTTYEPTPPIPKIATLELFILSIPSFPINNSVLEN